MSLTFNTPVAIRIFLPLSINMFNNDKVQTNAISNKDMNIKNTKQAKAVKLESIFSNVFTTKNST